MNNDIPVVIVEDLTMMREMLSEVVDKCPGVRLVSEHANAQSYLSWMDGIKDQYQYDRLRKKGILISDIVMPGMGGYELLKINRQNWPDMRTMALTGTEEGWLIETLVGLVDAFVSKHDGKTCITMGLRSIGQNRPYISPSIAESTRQRLDNPTQSPLESLTDNQKDIMCMLFDGMRNKAVATKTERDEATVSATKKLVLENLKPLTLFEIYGLFVEAGIYKKKRTI